VAGGSTIAGTSGCEAEVTGATASVATCFSVAATAVVAGTAGGEVCTLVAATVAV
jgi:hypothetical protein